LDEHARLEGVTAARRASTLCFPGHQLGPEAQALVIATGGNDRAPVTKLALPWPASSDTPLWEQQKPLMPLLVGITNGISKGFSEKELQWTNGWILGSMCNVFNEHRLISRDPENWYWRLCATSNAFGEEVPSFVDLDFVKRMAAAGWSTNASSPCNDARFIANLAYLAVSTILGSGRGVEHKHGNTNLCHQVLRSDEFDEAIRSIDLSWLDQE